MNQQNALSKENDANLKIIERFHQLSGPMQRVVIGFVFLSILILVALLRDMMKSDPIAGRGAEPQA